MLITAQDLLGYPVLNLHLGCEVARVADLVLDPHQLQLVALRLSGPAARDGHGSFLPSESIREFSRAGLVIDSNDELVQPADLLRLQKVLELGFRLPGLRVVAKSGAKLGKVSDFTLDVASWRLAQLIVHRPALKAFLDPELIIPRSQILKVSNSRVTVKSEFAAPPEPALAAPLSANFINPFRKPDFAAEKTASADEPRPPAPQA